MCGGAAHVFFFFFFFFKQKTAYEMCGRDWSSDVCSSDLPYNEGDAFLPEWKQLGGNGGRGNHGADRIHVEIGT